MIIEINLVYVVITGIAVVGLLFLSRRKRKIEISNAKFKLNNSFNYRQKRLRDKLDLAETENEILKAKNKKVKKLFKEVDNQLAEYRLKSLKTPAAKSFHWVSTNQELVDQISNSLGFALEYFSGGDLSSAQEYIMQADELSCQLEKENDKIAFIFTIKNCLDIMSQIDPEGEQQMYY